MGSFFAGNIISFILGAFLGYFFNFIGKRLFGANKEFFKEIESFRKKLPPKDKKARLQNLDVHTHMDLTPLKHNITQIDIDLFTKALEDIDYTKIVFKKKYIIQYSNNIQKIIKTTESKLFLIGLLDEMLNEEKLNKRKLFLINKTFYKYINV